MDEQRGDGDPRPHVWTPPDAGASQHAAVGRSSPTWPGGTGVPDDEPDGPPPPPWERQRRTRRRWLVGLAAAAVLAVPIGLALAGNLGTDGSPTATGTPSPPADDPGAEDQPGDPVPGDTPLDAPDLDRLEGADAVFAQLLLDIDASEQVMVGFQNELRDIFQGPELEDVDELMETIAEAGAHSGDRLEAARTPLEQPVADVRAEAVREVYLEHLDSWVRYMRAVEADPLLLLGPSQDDGARYTLSINATADAFARSLQDQLPDDADPEVQRMVEQLLDRGFRPQGQSDV